MNFFKLMDQLASNNFKQVVNTVQNFLPVRIKLLCSAISMDDCTTVNRDYLNEMFCLRASLDNTESCWIGVWIIECWWWELPVNNSQLVNWEPDKWKWSVVTCMRAVHVGSESFLSHNWLLRILSGTRWLGGFHWKSTYILHKSSKYSVIFNFNNFITQK